MRISDWSSDVCSSDLWCRRPLANDGNLPDRPYSDGQPIASGRSPPRARSSPCNVKISQPVSVMPMECSNWAERQAARFTRYRSEEHTSELQSLMRTSYAVFCLKKKTHTHKHTTYSII